VLGALRRWANAAPAQRRTHRTRGAEELTCLAGHELVDLGAHTIDHPQLSALSYEQQRAQVQCCRAVLTRIANHSIDTFSYPYGGTDAYTEQTIRLVREAGFHRACSNFPGRVTRTSDPFQLPRLLVRDWTAAELRGRIKEVARC